MDTQLFIYFIFIVLYTDNLLYIYINKQKISPKKDKILAT